MKKYLAYLLTFCMFLCLLSGCGTPAAEEAGTAEGENGGETVTPDISATAKELPVKLHVTSSHEREGEVSSEEMLMNFTWTENGAVMEGYEASGDKKDLVRMEITFDDQKRPATMVTLSTPADEQPEEQKATFQYPKEGQVKVINEGYGDGEKYVLYEYDKNGRMTREEYPNYTRIYEYDDQGNCIRKLIDHKEVEDTEYKTVYTYGESGKATFAVETSSAGGEVQKHFSYYPNGNVMWVCEISNQGNVNMVLNPYNTKDFGWGMGRAGSGDGDYQAEKDAQGRIVKVIYTNPYDGKQRESTLAYDAKGRLVEHKSHHGTVKRWEYDAKGRLVKEVSVSDTSTSTTTYTYDDKGRMTEEKCTSDGGYGHTYTRVYNEEGMTTKMVESNVYNDGTTSTTTAEIEYAANAACKVSDQWAALFLMFFAVNA